MKLSGNLKKDVCALKTILDSDDMIYFDFYIGEVPAVVVYVDSVSDREMLGKQVLRPLSNYSGALTPEKLAAATEVANVKTGTDTAALVSDVLSGDPAFLVDGVKGYFSCDLKKYEVRAVAEPNSAVSIRSPRGIFAQAASFSVKKRITAPRSSRKPVAVSTIFECRRYFLRCSP